MIIKEFAKKNQYYIESDKLEEDLQYLLNNKIFTNIRVNPYHGYHLDNIDLICEILNTRLLEISIEFRYLSFTKLSLCTNLERLSIMDDNKNIDFSNFIKLKSLGFTYSKTFIGLEKLENIEKLVIGGATHYIYDCIKNYNKLKYLELIQAKKFGLDNVISDNHKIEHLELCYLRDVIDLQYLLSIKDTLKELRIQNCKNIINFEVINEFKALERFVIDNCNTIESSKIFDNLPNLKQVTVIGKSYFVDGDIQNLAKPGLFVGIDNKKHYNMKYEDFKKYFRNPPEQMP